jgi:hypothetical protein
MNPALQEALAALTSPTFLERSRALDALRLEAGTEAPAPELVPALCALLEAPGTPGRKELLDLALDLAATPSLRRQLEASWPSFERTLDEPEEALRLATVSLAVALPGAAPRLTPALQRHALEDESQAVRLGSLFALASLRAEVTELAKSLFRTERDPLDRLAGALALMEARVEQVDQPMVELALGLAMDRSVLLRCGDVPLLGNPRETLARALARHPDAALQRLVFKRLLEVAGDENWIDDGTAAGLLALGSACGFEATKRAAHLVASRAFGPTGGLDLLAVLDAAGLPTDPAELQRFLGPNLPIGQWELALAPKRWWQFWRNE